MIPLPSQLHGQSDVQGLSPHFATLPSRLWWGWETLSEPTTVDLLWQFPSGEVKEIVNYPDSMIHFHYILAGRGQLRLRHARYDVESGSAFLIVAPEYFSFGPHPQAPPVFCESLTIAVSGGSALVDIAQEMLAMHGPVFTLADTHPAVMALCACISLAAQRQLTDQTTMAMAILPIILALNTEVPANARAHSPSRMSWPI